jgi:hypothetical protein
MKEIINIIYQYYPRNIDIMDSIYFDSLETKRLIVAAKEAENKSGKWHAFLSALKGAYGEKKVSEWTQLFNLDACYKLRVCITDSNEIVQEMAVHVSIISKYFSVYVSTFDKKNRFKSFPQRCTLTTENEIHHFNRIKEQLSKNYPDHKYLDPELTQKIIPDVTIGNYHYGQATVFHCLFTTHIW